ncbi:MAG: hypothetical protein ACI9J3_001273, partial [Parvicellaceae bacterium]
LGDDVLLLRSEVENIRGEIPILFNTSLNLFFNLDYYICNE